MYTHVVEYVRSSLRLCLLSTGRVYLLTCYLMIPNICEKNHRTKLISLQQITKPFLYTNGIYVKIEESERKKKH